MANISEKILEELSIILLRDYPDVYLDAFTNKAAREKLKEIIRKIDVQLFSDDELKTVIQNLVGLGVIDKITSKDESITDINFNGTKLIITTNNDVYVYEKDSDNKEVDEQFIIKVIQKFANAVGKEFTRKNPIIDASLNNLRLNAVHNSIARDGTTMSLRVTKKKLALNRDNFHVFAPKYILDFLEAAIEAKSNICISGEVGTGKTEFLKFLISLIPFKQRNIYIEDTREGHVKELFPEKDIFCWLTSNSVGYTELIKAALRCNPTWITITESRGKEVYEMIQAVLSGHAVLTSLHAVNARAIPSRLVNMSKMGYTFDENALLDDIYKYFQFGIHLKKTEFNGKTIRYLAEIVEFLADGSTKTVFEQKESKDGITPFVYSYSKEFEERLIEHHSDYNGLPKMGGIWDV